MNVCNCKSYNAGTGETPEVPLQHKTNGTALIDACIAPVIKHLWDNNIWTINSCCGHNGLFGMPSIVLGENEENYHHIKKLIAEKDPRTFVLSQWKRVIV